VSPGSSANGSSLLRLNRADAIAVLIDKFQECRLITLGTMTSGCEASAAPNFYRFWLTAPGINQFKLGTSDGRTTSTCPAAMSIARSR
jgi:hypothetical protein